MNPNNFLEEPISSHKYDFILHIYLVNKNLEKNLANGNNFQNCFVLIYFILITF